MNVTISTDPDDRDTLNRVAWVLREVLALEAVTWGDAHKVLARLADGPDPARPWLPLGAVTDEEVETKARELHAAECAPGCSQPVNDSWRHYARTVLGERTHK